MYFLFQSAYIEHREVKAAQGVKIAAKDLEKAIAGNLFLKLIMFLWLFCFVIMYKMYFLYSFLRIKRITRIDI